MKMGVGEKSCLVDGKYATKRKIVFLNHTLDLFVSSEHCINSSFRLIYCATVTIQDESSRLKYRCR